jgi:hypothetical protein
VALANIIRLSLEKGAHAILSSATWQEIRIGMTKGRRFTRKNPRGYERLPGSIRFARGASDL